MKLDTGILEGCTAVKLIRKDIKMQRDRCYKEVRGVWDHYLLNGTHGIFI